MSDFFQEDFSNSGLLFGCLRCRTWLFLEIKLPEAVVVWPSAKVTTIDKETEQRLCEQRSELWVWHVSQRKNRKQEESYSFYSCHCVMSVSSCQSCSCHCRSSLLRKLPSLRKNTLPPKKTRTSKRERENSCFFFWMMMTSIEEDDWANDTTIVMSWQEWQKSFSKMWVQLWVGQHGDNKVD